MVATNANLWDTSSVKPALLNTANTVSPEEDNCTFTHILDSGCTKHLSPDLSLFTSIARCAPRHFNTANKTFFKATHCGEAAVPIQSNDLTLPNTLYAPELAHTLISIGCLDNTGYTVIFGHGKAEI